MIASDLLRRFNGRDKSKKCLVAQDGGQPCKESEHFKCIRCWSEGCEQTKG